MLLQPEREWVGLRPGRKSVRLEYEEIETEAGEVLRVVHNYGKHNITPFNLRSYDLHFWMFADTTALAVSMRSGTAICKC